MINDVPVVLEGNGQNHSTRGLHVVVINPADAHVESAKVFDTYSTSESFDAYISRDVPEGHIVVAACSDDCVTNLSDKGKQWFANMGSEEIWNLGYRCGFSFIGISGRRQAMEKRGMCAKDQVSLT